MWKWLENVVDGAFGAGLVLIVLPSVGLYFGMDKIAANNIVGLPILAIFGIMILFGALALIAAVFVKLGLSDRTQALALPEGSIRAVISLALIVLFAIISIMLYQALAQPYEISGLTKDGRDTVVKELSARVIAIRPLDCAVQPVAVARTSADAASGTGRPASAPSALVAIVDSASGECAIENKRFSVVVRSPPGQETTDLAKQLLILVGTLMTSVTSFYFASRGNPASTPDAAPPSPKNPPAFTGLTPPDIKFKDGDPFHLKIDGSNLEGIKDVTLKQGAEELRANKVVSSGNSIDCTFVPKTGQLLGQWDVSVTDAAGKVVPTKRTVILTRVP